jgi:hypothetical protein
LALWFHNNVVPLQQHQEQKPFGLLTNRALGCHGGPRLRLSEYNGSLLTLLSESRLANEIGKYDAELKLLFTQKNPKYGNKDFKS